MEQEGTLTRAGLKTPRAAAIAGIVFSILFIISLVLIRISVPSNPQDAGTWLSSGWKTVSFALHLLPFAGIAFLWFIGYGGSKKFQEDPHWRDHLLFYEYFHGDNGAGLGASHQTGWTGIIAPRHSTLSEAAWVG